MAKSGKWIALGWRRVMSRGQFWDYVTLAIIFKLIFFVAGMTGIGQLLLAGPIVAGVYAVVLGQMRTGKFELDRMQKGFDRFAPQMVAGLLVSLFLTLTGTAALVAIYIALFALISNYSTTANYSSFFLFIALFVILLSTVITLLVMALYLFCFPLILERKLDFWEAMEESRRRVQKDLGGFFVFVLALSVINLIGLGACIIGTTITLPISWCAVMEGYRELWPEETVK